MFISISSIIYSISNTIFSLNIIFTSATKFLTSSAACFISTYLAASSYRSSHRNCSVKKGLHICNFIKQRILFHFYKKQILNIGYMISFRVQKFFARENIGSSFTLWCIKIQSCKAAPFLNKIFLFKLYLSTSFYSSQQGSCQ